MIIPFYAFVLRHARQGLALVLAECHNCGNVGPIDVEGLCQRYGELEHLRRLENRLRCRRCRMLGSSHFKIVWPANSGR